MPECEFGHYHQNKCAINHYFKNDSNILLWHFYVLASFSEAKISAKIKFYLPLPLGKQVIRGA